MLHQGLARVCLITAHMTVVRAKIEKNIPRSRGGLNASAQEKAKLKFFSDIYDVCL